MKKLRGPLAGPLPTAVRRAGAPLAVFLLAAALAGCIDGVAPTAPDPPATPAAPPETAQPSLTVSPRADTVIAGGRDTLAVTLLGLSSTADDAIDWESPDTSIAAVQPLDSTHAVVLARKPGMTLVIVSLRSTPAVQMAMHVTVRP